MRYITPLLNILANMELKVELLHSDFSNVVSYSGGKSVTGSVGSTYMVGKGGGCNWSA